MASTLQTTTIAQLSTKDTIDNTDLFIVSENTGSDNYISKKLEYKTFLQDLSSKTIDSIPTASEEERGLIRVGDGLKINNSSLSVDYDKFPIAANDVCGMIRIGFERTNNQFPVSVSADNAVAYVEISDATDISSGLFSNENKLKLDTIEESANYYVLPIASADALGGIKVGENLEIAEDGTLCAVAYALTPATAETLGGIKVGENLEITEDGKLCAVANELKPATAETLGGIKVGENLEITEDGTLCAVANELKPATATTLGGIKVGENLTIAKDGTLNARTGSTTVAVRQIWSTGTKIAVISVDENAVDLYSPTPNISSLNITTELTSGKKLATISVNDKDYDIFTRIDTIVEHPAGTSFIMTNYATNVCKITAKECKISIANKVDRTDESRLFAAQLINESEQLVTLKFVDSSLSFVSNNENALAQLKSGEKSLLIFKEIQDNVFFVSRYVLSEIEPQYTPSYVVDEKYRFDGVAHQTSFSGFPTSMEKNSILTVQTVPVPEGDYTFDSWRDQDGNTYEVGDQIVITADLTLYADYKTTEHTIYTVEFISDGMRCCLYTIYDNEKLIYENSEGQIEEKTQIEYPKLEAKNGYRYTWDQNIEFDYRTIDQDYTVTAIWTKIIVEEQEFDDDDLIYRNDVLLEDTQLSQIMLIKYSDDIDNNIVYDVGTKLEEDEFITVL